MSQHTVNELGVVKDKSIVKKDQKKEEGLQKQGHQLKEANDNINRKLQMSQSKQIKAENKQLMQKQSKKIQDQPEIELKQEQKQSSSNQKYELSNSQFQFMCKICEQPILNCIQVFCGHSFCQYCLSQYLLKSKDCPDCGLKIRQKKAALNKKFDEIVQQFYHFIGQDQKKQFDKRKQFYKKKKQEKRIEVTQAGTLLDVRDEEYFWRRGRIVRTFNRLNNEQGRIKFLVVEYLDSERKQQFSIFSPRLAKFGYYTNRFDIPKKEEQGKPRKRVKLTKQDSSIGEKEELQNKSQKNK